MHLGESGRVLRAFIYALVAQLVERVAVNHDVAGSSPAGSAMAAAMRLSIATKGGQLHHAGAASRHDDSLPHPATKAFDGTRDTVVRQSRCSASRDAHIQTVMKRCRRRHLCEKCRFPCTDGGCIGIRCVLRATRGGYINDGRAIAGWFQ